MRARRLFLLVYAASGVAGLVYEVVWTRLLALQLGHTVAAVGAVLGAFMGGLAAGALVGGRVASRQDRGRALRTYAVIEIAIAASATLLPIALHALQPLLRFAYGDSPIGATFPFAIRWFAGAALNARRDAGSLYAVNTLGAATGALVAGFVLVPQIGLRATTFIAIALNLTTPPARGSSHAANRPTSPGCRP